MEGVPYNVTVFATNGRGRGPTVSKVAYAEEDGKYINLFRSLCILKATNEQFFSRVCKLKQCPLDLMETTQQLL